MSLEKITHELGSDVMRSRGPITCTHRCIHGCPEILSDCNLLPGAEEMACHAEKHSK